MLKFVVSRIFIPSLSQQWSLASAFRQVRRILIHGDDTRYGMLFGLRKIFILSAHIGLLSKLSENTDEKADNVLVRREEKQLPTAATAGKEAGKG